LRHGHYGGTMPNLAAGFKEEICRLARKETKSDIKGLRGAVIALKRAVREQKVAIAGLAREMQRLAAAVAAGAGPVTAEALGPEEAPITVRNVRALRKKLKLSQADFGKLLGLNQNTIWHWERKRGRLKLRAKAKESLAAIKDLDAREAGEKLASMRKPKRGGRAKRRRRARR
jgi:DNA-binding transcriptional regulator YiaG